MEAVSALFCPLIPPQTPPVKATLEQIPFPPSEELGWFCQWVQSNICPCTAGTLQQSWGCCCFQEKPQKSKESHLNSETLGMDVLPTQPSTGQQLKATSAALQSDTWPKWQLNAQQGLNNPWANWSCSVSQQRCQMVIYTEQTYFSSLGLEKAGRYIYI